MPDVHLVLFLLIYNDENISSSYSLSFFNIKPATNFRPKEIMFHQSEFRLALRDLPAPSFHS